MANNDMIIFSTLVKEMRDAQKLYFKTRKTGVLIRAKELEARVDRMIVQIQNKEQPD